MKTLLPFRIKSALAVLVLILLSASNVFAQPQYYNFNTTGTNNVFPLGNNPATGKSTQSLYLAGAFSQPAPAPAGNITKLYLMCSQTGSATFTSLTIKFGQTVDVDLPTGAWYTGSLTTVYNQTNVNVAGTAGQFLVLILDTPFSYDPTKSLVVEIAQCGFSGAGIGLGYTALSGFKRSAGPLSPVACPHPWGNQNGYSTHAGIDVAPAAQLPDILYYKFERNPAPAMVINCGTSGTPLAPIAGVTLTSGGQFDSCITGTGVTSSGVTTGWNNNLGTSSWTIGMWVDITSTTFGYLFGDGAGSFRCFNNGAAGTNAITLRGTGITNVDVTGFASGPVYVHFVYDSAAANIKVYKDGVLSNTVPQTPLNLATGTGFRVGGYTTSAGYVGKMDEFRVYRRALLQAEITATWNTDIGDCELTPIVINNNEVPAKYILEQNYPNPFNPSTVINFSLPVSGSTDLRVFDILGREVAVLVNGFIVAGNHSVPFDASSFATGVYFYTLISNEFRETKKMLLIK